MYNIGSAFPIFVYQKSLVFSACGALFSKYRFKNRQHKPEVCRLLNCVAIGIRKKTLDDLFFLGDPVYPHFDLSFYDLIFFSVFFLAFFPPLTIAECS